MNRWFFALWFFVIFVSVYDAYLLIHYRSMMAIAELNPSGRWLIHLNGGNVWLMLVAKTLGTIFAAATLLVLYWNRPRLAYSPAPPSASSNSSSFSSSNSPNASLCLS